MIGCSDPTGELFKLNPPSGEVRSLYLAGMNTLPSICLVNAVKDTLQS